ncbi:MULTISPECIES: hypothetical protein [unclassified Sphingomonas]|uniref:hypothetical protein n=1 Tax=unclassified Sphingomonas TaxID=196159 RepID=UPI0028615CAE|nr:MULTISPECIES: hypothetical protein [unclassified Sphingomonas]MDR6116536.1 hypothetical protein [Sphingomonas sp. SORGH_AS_0789]MDR6149788.1 hypothetical protein [Sphingomonas sp. SORGH_AS_0742]
MTNDRTQPIADKPSVFISGSISIRHLPTAVLTRLLEIIDRRLPVLIGDARGVDSAVQRLLMDQRAPNVTVSTADGFPRNNIGDWAVRNIPGEGRAGTAGFHATKDRAMAAEAGAGLVIWDGRSRGSLANVHRLCERQCFVAVWLGPEGRFENLNSTARRGAFVNRYPCRAR